MTVFLSPKEVSNKEAQALRNQLRETFGKFNAIVCNIRDKAKPKLGFRTNGCLIVRPLLRKRQ